VLGLSHHRRRAVDLAARVDQLRRVEQVATVVALVSARLLEAADRALAFDVAIGQEAASAFGIELLLLLLEQVAVVVQRQEHILRHAMVVLGVGVREQVERDAELLVRFEEQQMIALEHLARRDAFLVGLHRDRRAVAVAAGHHQHLVPLQAVVAGENVGRQVGARDVAEMLRAVGVRPGDAHQNLVGHESLLANDDAPIVAYSKQIAYGRSQMADGGLPFTTNQTASPRPAVQTLCVT